MDISALNGMEQPELLKLAISQGITVHHKLGKEKIIKAIVEAAMTPPAVDHPKVVAAEPVHFNTAEEVEAALEATKARFPALRTSYPGDGTWVFEWVDNQGRVRRNESGNLAIPMRVIKQKALNVAEGPRAPRAADPRAFEPGFAGGNSVYTNNVLMG